MNDRVDRNWLVGFVSGYAYGSGVDILKTTDPDSLYFWMDSYCMKNPLDRLIDGVNVLGAELAKKNR